MGLVVSLDPEKAALPYLPADRERLLEYDLARAIGRVIATNKPVIGVMTSLPMFGSPMNPMMAMRMGQQPQRPWVFIQELQRDYDVRQIQMDVDKIDDAIQVLVVAHPKEISDKAQYAIPRCDERHRPSAAAEQSDGEHDARRRVVTAEAVAGVGHRVRQHEGGC
jgi:ABC-type uncharacterized transport system involved in gliding motility auxiliary subunit